MRLFAIDRCERSCEQVSSGRRRVAECPVAIQDAQYYHIVQFCKLLSGCSSLQDRASELWCQRCIRVSARVAEAGDDDLVVRKYGPSLDRVLLGFSRNTRHEYARATSLSLAALCVV